MFMHKPVHRFGKSSAVISHLVAVILRFFTFKYRFKSYLFHRYSKNLGLQQTSATCIKNKVEHGLGRNFDK